MGDAGTAKYLALYSGGNLLRYERDRFFQKFIFGAGADLIANGSIFYHVPISLAAGIHQGTQKRYGGDTFFYFAVGVGLDRGSMR